MRISMHWLREWLELTESAEEIGHRLTMAGLELEAVEPAAPEATSVVVGKLLDVSPHPEADRLRLCQVDVGLPEPLHIVCGAANVAPDMRVAVALSGARLPGGIHIETHPIRGQVSEGMICSAAELGLEESSEGILPLPDHLEIGVDLRTALALDDFILEVDLTPNRADCLSMLGIARELAVLLDRPFRTPEIQPVPPVVDSFPQLRIEAQAACPVYAARRIEQLDTRAVTPLWMRERLRRAGVRPLYPAVDVTNYVMLELGQPLHAFDADLLGPEIQVRWGAENEKLRLLNGQEIEVRTGDLVIAHDQGPIALAGIMGGSSTAIGPDTQTIVLESAHFVAQAIAGRARAHGLHTDASHRFERGVDPTLPVYALERATALLLAITGGQAGPIVSNGEIPPTHQEKPIRLRLERIPRLLGMAFAAPRIEQILQGLGCRMVRVEPDWEVFVPRSRFDLALEEDLIEELARIHGYTKLPQTLPSGHIPRRSGTVEVLHQRKKLLANLGFFEVVSYSFIAPDWSDAFFPETSTRRLLNPISSDLAVMRAGLWPGLARIAAHNIARQQTDLRVFEYGLVFEHDPTGELRQENRLAGLLCGRLETESWQSQPRNVDFFDAKGVVETLLAAAGITVQFEPSLHPALHDGQSARLVFEGRPVGWLGALHPELVQRLDLLETFVFELDAQLLLRDPTPAFQPLSVYPAVRRDLAFVVDESVSAADILSTIAALQFEELRDVRLFDVYRGKNLGANEKSIALGLILRAFDRTLADAEVEQVTDAIMKALTVRMGARPRS